MDPLLLLQVTRIEQAVARERAAGHNAAVRARRAAGVSGRGGITGWIAARRSVSNAPACATC